MPENETPSPTSPSQTDEGGWSLTRTVVIFAGGFILLIVALFLISFVIALFGDPQILALRMQYFRDLALIVLATQGILIVTALAILVIQVARLVNLLRSEAKPITEDAQQALQNVRATTEFVYREGVAPVVGMKAFVAGLKTFLLELFRIRRLMRRPKR